MRTWRSIKQWAEVYKELLIQKEPQEALGAKWAKHQIENGISERILRRLIDGNTDSFDVGARNYLNSLKEKENG